jgi:hypothetical protein
MVEVKTLMMLFGAAISMFAASAQYTEVPLSDTYTRINITSTDLGIRFYEVQITISLPNPNGPATKREVAYTAADARGRGFVIFDVPMEEITDVRVLCYCPSAR